MFINKEQRDQLLVTLRVLGVHTAMCLFDGSGDSGTIGRPTATDINGNLVSLDAKLPWTRRKSVWVPALSRFDDVNEHGEVALSDILYDLVDDELQRRGIDWYNNDGGYGELIIGFDTSPPRIELNVNIRYTEVNTYSFDFTNEFTEEGAPCIPTTTA